MSLKANESAIVVLETPELQKTIEELNDEIEPKTFTQTNLGLDSKPRELTVTEILEVISSEKTRPDRPIFPYVKEPKQVDSKISKLKLIENELLSIGESLGSLNPKDPDFDFCQEEFVNLSQKLEQIQEKSQLVSKKHSFPKTQYKKITDFSSANNITFDLSLTEVEDRNRLSRLENKIREIEFALGTWKQSKQVSEALSEFILKTKFLNPEFLDRLKEQARHLGTDLDMILSSESQGSTTDNSKDISNLFKETYPYLSNISKLSLYIDKLKSSYDLFTAHSKLAKGLFNIEISSENMLGSASHSLIAQENLKEGLEENWIAFQKSIKKFK